MNNINKIGRFILSFEGGYVNDKNDSGGPTNKGVTLKTLNSIHLDKNKDGKVDLKDLRLLCDIDVIERVLRPYFWDKVQAERIKNEWVAYLIVDWYWNSGTIALKKIQKLIGVRESGKFNDETIERLNFLLLQKPKEMFSLISMTRDIFFKSLVREDYRKKKYLSGWQRRNNSIKYGQLICNDNEIIF